MSAAHPIAELAHQLVHQLLSTPLASLTESCDDARALDGHHRGPALWRACPLCGAHKVNLTVMEDDEYGFRRFCWSCKKNFSA